MTEKRFTVETSENQLIIVDNDGIDDYYHLGCDERDVKGICKMLNDLNKDNQEEIQAFKKQNKELTQLIKTLIKENLELKETIKKEFSITKEDLNKEEDTRITRLTNQILVEFCKSKGHSLEEITEFVEGLPNE